MPQRPRADLPPASPPPLDRQLAALHYPELAAYLDDLEEAHEANYQADVDDISHIETLIEGLNLSDPRLKLEFLDSGLHHLATVAQSGLATRLAAAIGTGAAFQAVLNCGEHRVGMSVRCSGDTNDVSLLVIDSRGYADPREYASLWAQALGAMADHLQGQLGQEAPPARLRLSLAPTGTQKSSEGCCIFALSAAKKMASDPALEDIHSGALADLREGRAGTGVVALAAGGMPPSLFKHATSKKVVEHYLAKRHGSLDAPDARAPVNKKGQDLLQRHAQHKIHRRDPFGGRASQPYSNSYEAKRIELIRTALRSLVAAKGPGSSAR